MSLSDVLTAVRKLILDPIDLPEDAEARRADYSSRFPKLKAEEIEDLAKMDPRRIRTYTDSIFSGQTSILEDKFEITFAVISACLESQFKEKFYPFDFVRAVHAARPWLDNATEALGRNLIEYLKNDRPEIIAAAPEVLDAAEIELASLLVIRAPNDIVSARDSLKRAELEALPVARLMEVEMIVPSYVQLRKFEFDAPSLRRAFYDGGKKLPEKRIEKRPVLAAAGRNYEFFVRWRELSQPVFDLLSELQRSVPTPLEELAAAVTDTLPPETDEVEAFRAFYVQASDLAESGIIILR